MKGEQTIELGHQFPSYPLASPIGHEPLILLRHERGRNEKICGGPVAGDRNIPHHGDAEQRFHIRIVGMRLQRIPEENENVDVAFANLRPDLLITAQRPALHSFHWKVQLLMKQCSRSPSCDECVPCKGFAIELGPGQQILLLVVMRHDGNRFLFGHRHRVVVHGHLLLTRFHSFYLNLERVWQTVVTGTFRDPKPFSINDLGLACPSPT